MKTYADAVGPWKPYLVKTVDDGVERTGDTTLNINDRRHFEKGGWIAFDPGADDPNAIADALAQRSTQR